MYHQSGVVGILLLVTLPSLGVAGLHTCGASQKGTFLEDFHGSHSYVSYTIDAGNMKEDSLEYQDRFCTKNSSGIIAKITSVEQKEDIIIEVVDGHTEIHLEKDGVEPVCIFTLNQLVTDGVNYLIKIGLKRKQLKMTLFRQYTEIYSVTVADIGPCLESKFSTFTFLEKGGENIDVFHSGKIQEYRTLLHGDKPYLHGDFDGCIGDSMFNGIPLSKAGTQTQHHDIDPTCQHSFGPECTDICATSYIATHGKNCACPRNSEVNKFGLCEETCNCFKCQNGGSCNLIPESDVKCKCPPGYEGKYCELDPCRKLDCLNGGSCNVRPNGSYCTCPPNYTGFVCEVFIPPPEDPCEKSPCDNNATCVRNSTLVEKYFCNCLDGYYGQHCEYEQKNSGTELTFGTTVKALIGLGSAVIILVFGGIVALLLRRHRSRKKNKTSDNNS